MRAPRRRQWPLLDPNPTQLDRWQRRRPSHSSPPRRQTIGRHWTRRYPRGLLARHQHPSIMILLVRYKVHNPCFAFATPRPPAQPPRKLLIQSSRKRHTKEKQRWAAPGAPHTAWDISMAATMVARVYVPPIHTLVVASMSTYQHLLCVPTGKRSGYSP